MIDIDSWLESCMKALKETFGDRLWFVGLQGSYGRGEATETSDIDMVVILDALSPADIAAYRGMLAGLEHRELICGFLSGREELLCWESSDLFQFCHDTTPILGSLDPILEKVDADAVDRAIRIGACNVYHACVHNMVFERDTSVLRGLYKAATFVIRAAVYRRTKRFCRHLQELDSLASTQEREIISAYTKLLQDGEADFDSLSGLLFAWAQQTITEA